MAQLPARLAAEAARQDQEERWKRSEKVSAERYLDALPQVVASPEDAMLLISAAGLLRGTQETLNLGCYPHLADHLAALGKVHGVMLEGGFSTTGDVGPVPVPKSVPAVAGYELLRQIGQGGMGVVWQARQLALGQHNVARKELESACELLKKLTSAFNQWYTFACVYAVASGHAADKKQEYADRAMELLLQAVKAGYKNAAQLRKDTDLDPLREREDFKTLLADRGTGK